MISQISSSSCIGGSKGAQLRCRAKFAEKVILDMFSRHVYC